MKQQKQDKTNVMRLLDAAGIAYRVQEYEVDENDLSGIHVANQIGEDPDSVFKTLVLKGEKRGFLVCCIPVAEELDLKKVARAVGDKKVEMLPMKELLSTTGYIRGGCLYKCGNERYNLMVQAPPYKARLFGKAGGR